MTRRDRIGRQFITELKAKLATESKAYKWHRKAEVRHYMNSSPTSPVRLSKKFILEKYFNE